MCGVFGYIYADRDLFAGDSFSLMFTTLDSMLKISVVCVFACACCLFFFSSLQSLVAVSVSLFNSLCLLCDQRRSFTRPLNRLHLFLHFIFWCSFYCCWYYVRCSGIPFCASIWFVFVGIIRIVCILLLRVKRISKINSNCIVSVFIISCAVLWTAIFFFCFVSSRYYHDLSHSLLFFFSPNRIWRVHQLHGITFLFAFCNNTGLNTVHCFIVSCSFHFIFNW